jgi:SAM-dependent methyltransferase
MTKMSFNPNSHLPGGFSSNDGTIEFYSRVKFFLRPHHKVLDYGAGRGEWFYNDKISYRRELRSFKGRCFEYVGCDIDSAVLTNKTVDKAFLIDAEGNIPFSDESFDLIICDWVLEHISKPDEFTSEIKRVLRPGGVFCARTPYKYNFISLLAAFFSNSMHSKILKFVQPERLKEDVFPTCYKMNTFRDLTNSFSCYSSYSYIHMPEPAYFFGSALLFKLQSIAYKILPRRAFGNIHVFLIKPEC